ncbi:MAG: replication factor C small subunit [Candidatus Lokiarchaeota archaeon]|nr:replication factor C small subunit [Candidatus Lokiarchaeota archaeon]
MDAPFVEKYRPRSLKDVVGQDEIITRLKGFVTDRSMPHLILAGPAGTGKTTSAIALARDMFKDTNTFSHNYKELNASDARGIGVVRTMVKDFARTQPTGDVPFKILVLDEADNMTAAAQHALRRTMENFTKSCRFILICNYSNRIIAPIQSRCAVLRFTPLSDEDIAKRLRLISEKEGINLTKKGGDAILYVSGGDCRKAVNVLQAVSTISKDVTEESVYQVTGRVYPEQIREMIRMALDGELNKSQEKLESLLMEFGLAGSEIIKQIHAEIFNMDVPEPVRIGLIRIVGEIDFRLNQGASEMIQLNALLAKIVLLNE